MERPPAAPDNRIEKEPQLLSDIEPIEEGGLVFRQKEDIDKLVELPLVDACKQLYDKNIQTWQSSANKKDIQNREVYVIVVSDSLSEENKLIAKEIGEPFSYGETELVKLSVPVSEATTIAEIKTKMDALVERLKSQPPTWIEGHGIDYFKKIYGPGIIEEDLIGSLSEEGGLYFDRDSRLFYPSEEQFKKVSDWKNSSEV